MSEIENARKLFFEALELLDSGDFHNAELRLRDALYFTPNSVPVLTNLSVAILRQKRFQEAYEYAEKAVSANRNNTEALFALSACYQHDENYVELLNVCDEIIAIEPGWFDAHNNRGLALQHLRRFAEALDSCERAIALEPNNFEPYSNRGNVLRNLNRYVEALESYELAIALQPDGSAAWLGRGNVFSDLKRYDEAFAAYDKALSLKPDLAAAWLGRGNVFSDLKRYDEAFAAYDKALALKPDLEGAWLGRGNVFSDLKRYDEAFAAYDKALPLKPDLAEAWLGRGNVFSGLKRYDEAFAAYDTAFSLNPELTAAEGSRLYAKMHRCDWNNFDAECEHLISSINNGKLNTSPFPLLAIPSSSDDQLRYAKLWTANTCPPSDKPIWRGERYNHSRIRVAYASADFHQHATSILMAGMFDCHDKSCFDVTAISFGPDNNSEMRQRLKASFEQFVDAGKYSDEKIALHIRETEIDILIDLKGFTQDARTSIFARRPAPIQVNYLGYPGTMGASYIDYIIADKTVIPGEYRKFYAEKITDLPNTYQANDRGRVISDKAFNRSDMGLPSQGFVFCCFNNTYKITPHVYDCWMRLLMRVEGSVLWLLEDNAAAAGNLRRKAVARSVNPERLIFAKRLPVAEHLARHRLADLFLDTLPCNAHTTASDALWAGLPVLTCLGETFAGRVAASLLNAIGLPELIAATPKAYEQMAVDLATHPEKLAVIKRKLAENRLTTPLFDTKRFTKHIEAAYTAMYERYQAGLPPDHIVIPN